MVFYQARLSTGGQAFPPPRGGRALDTPFKSPLEWGTNKWDRRRFEEQLGFVLRAGVLLSSAVVAFRGVIFLLRHGEEIPAYWKFAGEPPELTSYMGTFSQTLAGSGRGIIQAGLLLLIATPVVRMVFTGFMYTRQRD